jgi:heat shock protein HslJ
MACVEPEGIMEQEDAFLAALESAARYQVQGDQLTLFTAEGNMVVVMTTIQDTPLTSTNWTLITYNNGNQGRVSTLAGSEITAMFDDAGKMGGKAGCNNYNASYTIDGENMTIGPAASTRMACSTPEGIMEQEAAYLAALERVSAFEINGDELVLLDETGQGLLYFAASQ